MEGLYRAFFPPVATRILGYRLRPYCAGHRLALEAIGSPFASEEPQTVNRGDLILALRICAGRYPFAYSLRPTVKDFLTRVFMGGRRFDRAVRTFLEHMAAHTQYPEFWKPTPGAATSQGQGEPVTAPPILSLMVSLVGAGYSEREAWEMSLARAVWIDSTRRELAGAPVRFFDAEAVEAEARDARAGVPDLEKLTREQKREYLSKAISPEFAKRWYTEASRNN